MKEKLRKFSRTRLPCLVFISPFCCSPDQNRDKEHGECEFLSAEEEPSGEERGSIWSCLLSGKSYTWLQCFEIAKAAKFFLDD